jgi:TPR repeat protein
MTLLASRSLFLLVFFFGVTTSTTDHYFMESAPLGTKLSVSTIFTWFPQMIPRDLKLFQGLMIPILDEYNESLASSIANHTEKCDAFEKAAAENNLYALVLHGMCFGTGNGRPFDMWEALRQWQYAADNGSAVGAALYAYEYPQSDPTANAYLQRAAEQQEPCAQSLLGWDLLMGSPNASDHEAGVRLLRDSADRGNVFGEFVYGVCCLFGYNATVDEEKGIAYLAHTRTHSTRDIVVLGGLALLSAGGEKAAAAATEHFRAGAQDESPVAQMFYASALERGIGVEQNKKEAALWYTKGIDNGYSHDSGKDALARLTQDDL